MKLSIAEGRDLFSSTSSREEAKKFFESEKFSLNEKTLPLIGKEEDRYPYTYESTKKK